MNDELLLQSEISTQEVEKLLSSEEVFETSDVEAVTVVESQYNQSALSDTDIHWIITFLLAFLVAFMVLTRLEK